MDSRREAKSERRRSPHSRSPSGHSGSDGKDAASASAMFKEASIESIICADLACLARSVEEDAGTLLIAEEAIGIRSLPRPGGDLIEAAAMVRPSSASADALCADSNVVAAAVHALGNVTLLERPVRPATLLSAVRAALKARERQYQVAKHLAEQAQINAQLEASIKERQRVEEALRDADRRKDEFLATLAHELRNPLAPIRNSLHILRLAGGSDSATEQVAEMMDDK